MRIVPRVRPSGFAGLPVQLVPGLGPLAIKEGRALAAIVASLALSRGLSGVQPKECGGTVAQFYDCFELFAGHRRLSDGLADLGFATVWHDIARHRGLDVGKVSGWLLALATLRWVWTSSFPSWGSSLSV